MKMVKTEMNDKDYQGLKTVDALNRLHRDIQQVLNQFIASQQERKSTIWIRDAFHHQSMHTTITWISVAYILFVILMQTILSVQDFGNFVVGLLQTIFLLSFLTLSIVVELIENKLRHNEIVKRVIEVLQKIENVINRNSWLPENYPNPLIPFSPSITLQWTYRDNQLVNLPWALLVKDDIILIRPGQISPGFCEAIEKHSEYQLLHAKEVYGPTIPNANECFTTPKLRKPLQSKRYKLLETPYLNNLKVYFEQALDRPITIENTLRHFLMIGIVEKVLFPLVVGLVVFINFIKYFYFDAGEYTNVWQLFVGVPISTVLPLLPLVFPIAWNFINYFGIARFKLFVKILHSNDSKSFFVESDAVLGTQKCPYKIHDVWKIFKSILKGKEVMLGRTTNFLHVLGSLTALCCVDKKGILSWPNPSAEKVFFLHNDTGSILQPPNPKCKEEKCTNEHNLTAENSYNSIPEVLDITHHPNDPFQLHFDNSKWNKYLSSLKPLGLAILLNTCNMETQENYTNFCSHITCEAMYNENLVPVTNRRCLCELAKEIGFIDEAQNIFSLEQQMCTFRHLQNEVIRRDSKFARSLHMTTKLKFPFPHMFAVSVKEAYSGSTQLLSQGTADIILDSCVDYWDGYDINTLSKSDRRKIQDFYQRSSLTSYCTAFSYRPLHKGFSNKISKTYLELPRDCVQLYANQHSPSPGHCDNTIFQTSVVPECANIDLLQHQDSTCSDASECEDCFELQCNQVFIGMVSMQYQAQQDMVDLIEQLEKACIRFVHFSKENELRSRVFNEKMGLESGWNCHISLLSERGSMVNSSKALSYSAPGAINLEHSVVKFSTEREPLTMYVYDQEMEDIDDPETGEFHAIDLANASHEWQSLSCLTDSTESAPVNFDMSNRAMLPRGIEQIRPHIENIDNVPLLVSLFTDCTPSNTREMLKIMQEYGEVICVIGSSASNGNSGVFMQANASISVEPLYPQVCCKRENYKPVMSGSISPIELSTLLNSIPCSLSVRRDDPLTIYYLIVEARAFTTLLRNTMQFWLCSCLAVSFMQLLAAFLMLPPLLTIGQVMWIVCFIIPLLSTSLMGTPVDREDMKKPQSKKPICFSYQRLMFVLHYYGLKFASMVFIIITCFSGTLASYCMDSCISQNCSCRFFMFPEPYTQRAEVNNWIGNAQQFSVILILLHMITISITFIHRQDLVWRKSPLQNCTWLFTVIFLLIFQTGFSLYNLNHSAIQYKNNNGSYLGKIVAIFAFISPFITLFMCEIVKCQEIKENNRCERRRKLEFGTKLGMNSPF